MPRRAASESKAHINLLMELLRIHAVRTRDPRLLALMVLKPALWVPGILHL